MRATATCIIDLLPNRSQRSLPRRRGACSITVAAKRCTPIASPRPRVNCCCAKARRGSVPASPRALPVTRKSARRAGGSRAPAGSLARSHRAAFGGAISYAGRVGKTARTVSSAAGYRRHARGERLIPSDVAASTDALALLRFGAANGFFIGAVTGLVRTVLSDYWQLAHALRTDPLWRNGDDGKTRHHRIYRARCSAKTSATIRRAWRSWARPRSLGRIDDDSLSRRSRNEVSRYASSMPCRRRVAWLGRQGSRAIAAVVFIAIAVPRSTRCSPFVTEAIFALPVPGVFCASDNRKRYAAYRRPGLVLAATAEYRCTRF